ncbi:MAG: hypothetical protein ACXV5Q_00635 [Frankiaceae bacterium]
MPSSADDGPTLGEVVRRLEDVARQLAELTSRLDSTYLRKDLADANRASDVRVMTDLRTDLDAIVDQQRKNRNLAVAGFVLPVLVGVVTALILAAVLPL